MREGGGERAPPTVGGAGTTTGAHVHTEPQSVGCLGGRHGSQGPPPPAPSRVPWAEARAKFFSRGKNRASLDCIERAAFFLALDEEPQGFNPEREESLSDYAKSLLHGRCYNR